MTRSLLAATLLLAPAMASASLIPNAVDGSKPFDQYSWVTTHNAFATTLLNNQSLSIGEQLEDGVRGLMLDIHPSNGRVRLCHGTCIGLEPALAELINDTLLPFLVKNPFAIVSLHLEDYTSHAELTAELARAPGLAGKTFDPSSWTTPGWPVYDAIVDAGQRVMIFDLKDANSGQLDTPAGPIHIMSSGDFTVENYWSIGNTIGEHDFSCKSRWNYSRLDRPSIPVLGKSGWRPLFTLNHFHGVPLGLHSSYDNSYATLKSRYVDYCLPAAGREPNFVAVDFYQEGNVAPFVGSLTQGAIEFHDENDGRGNLMCGLPGQTPINVDLKSGGNRGCTNDDARSATIRGVKAGTRLRVFDSPDGSRSDDWATVTVNRDLLDESVIVPSFEKSYADEDVTVESHYVNGLDGKVSRIVVEPVY